MPLYRGNSKSVIIMPKNIPMTSNQNSVITLAFCDRLFIHGRIRGKGDERMEEKMQIGVNQGHKYVNVMNALEKKSHLTLGIIERREINPLNLIYLAE